ncbi:MAG TPA: hypothetical protein VFN49_02730, partial [Candidatus Aquilonibacter sp.]|nr:hypothetical protein [Candidatus Aquilonibacter sp.]
TSFGDVGRALPAVYVVHGGRIADYAGLASVEQAVALVQEETTGRDASEPVVILTVSRAA